MKCITKHQHCANPYIRKSQQYRIFPILHTHFANCFSELKNSLLSNYYHFMKEFCAISYPIFPLPCSYSFVYPINSFSTSYSFAYLLLLSLYPPCPLSSSFYSCSFPNISLFLSLHIPLSPYPSLLFLFSLFFLLFPTPTISLSLTHSYIVFLHLDMFLFPYPPQFECAVC